MAQTGRLGLLDSQAVRNAAIYAAAAAAAAKLHCAEQQQQQQQRQQDGNDGNRTELFARLKDIASARHGIAVDVVPPAEETPAAAAGGEAAVATAAETPAPPREK